MVSTAHSTAVGAQETWNSFAVSSWRLRFPSLRSCCAVRVLYRCTLFACVTLVMRKERLRSQEGVKYPRKVSRVEGSGSLLSIKEKLPPASLYSRYLGQGTLSQNGYGKKAAKPVARKLRLA